MTKGVDDATLNKAGDIYQYWSIVNKVDIFLRNIFY